MVNMAVGLQTRHSLSLKEWLEQFTFLLTCWCQPRPSSLHLNCEPKLGSSLPKSFCTWKSGSELLSPPSELIVVYLTERKCILLGHAKFSHISSCFVALFQFK